MVKVNIHSIDINSLESRLERCIANLDEQERSRATRFAFEHLRQKFSIIHGTMREILASYVGISPRELIFRQGKYGKPYLKNYPNLYFNLSHSGDLAVLAIVYSTYPLDIHLGVDIEEVREGHDITGITCRYMTSEERASILDKGNDRISKEFLRIWTRKEAVVKCLGTGLHTPLSKFSVPTGDAPSPRRVQTSYSAITMPLYLQELELNPIYASNSDAIYKGAICLNTDKFEVQYVK